MLLCIDAIQITVLALNPEFGWSPALVQWMDTFSMLDLLLPQRDPAWFNLVFVLVLLLVVASLVDAAYVAYMFQKSNFKHVWPLKVLRAMASLLVTAGFVPAVGILTSPWSCGKMKVFNGDDFDCGGSHRVGFVLMSVLALVFYLPFGLASSLVFHESDGNSPSWTAKVHGTEAMFGTIAKIMGVVGSLFVHTQPVMFALVMSGTYAMIGGHVVATLPFFHSFMNQFRVAVSFFVSYLWLGSLVFAATPHSSHAILSAAWVPLAVIPIGIALVLPWYRMKSLRLRLCAMRPAMLRELAATHAQTPSEWQARTGSVRVTNAGTLAHTRRARRMSIQALNTRARTSRQRSKALPLSLLEELEMHGSRDRRKGKWFAQRLVPTTQGVEHVMWLFVQAIEEFGDDPVDIAIVKIAYARFLQVFTADVNMATAALETAAHEQPSFEGEFEVFSRCKALQQKRQSQNLGADKDMNLIAIVEYEKRLEMALVAHKAAANARLTLVQTLTRFKELSVTSDEDRAVMAERIGGLVQTMRNHIVDAHWQYSRLMRTHPNAPNLGRMFRHFCRHMLQDEAMASQFSSDDGGTHDGYSEVGTHVTGAGQSVMTSLTSGLESLRSLQPRTRTKEVSFLTVAFKIGTAMLMAVAVGIFVVAQVEISAAGAELSTLSKATTQHHYAARSAQWARELSLNGINSVNEQAMRADMDVLKAALHTIRFVGARRAYVEELWHTPSINVDMYAGNGTWYTMPTNLYDLGSQLVAHMYALGQEGLGSNYSENTHWRFVMDNAVTQAVPEFKGLQSALSQSILDYRDLYLDLQIVMVAVLFLSLFALGQCVYRRAVHRVSVIKRGILDVVQAMEQAQLKLLLKEAKSSRRFVLRASASVASGHDVEQGGGLNPSRSRSAKDKVARPARQGTSTPVSSPIRNSRRKQAGRVSPASPSLPTISEPTVAAASNQQRGVTSF